MALRTIAQPSGRNVDSMVKRSEFSMLSMRMDTTRERSEKVILHFGQDKSLYGEGDQADLVFKVLSGVVRTCKYFRNGRRQIYAFHAADDVFGFEVGTEHSLSAEAVCDCTVTSYRQHSSASASADDAVVPQQLFSQAMRSLARAQDHSIMLGRRSALAKVAAFIVEWADHAPELDTVTLAMARQDIADYLGLTIETVARTLSFLERAAVIELPTAREIRLKDASALRRLNAEEPCAMRTNLGIVYNSEKAHGRRRSTGL